MLPLLIYAAFCFDQILGQTVHNIVIARGQHYEFSNPNYPADLGWDTKTIDWNFMVEPDAKVKVVCDDIRMAQRTPYTQDCPHVYLAAIDNNGERRVCGGSVYNFVHKSDSSRLTIRIASTTEGSGLFKCTALNTGEPTPTENIQLHPNGRARKIKIQGTKENPLPYLDRLYTFECPEGTRMSFQCSLSLSSMKPMCGKISFIFNNGENDEEFCESANHIWFTKTNKGKIRLQLDQFGHGDAECLIQAVTGPHPNEFENAVSIEVDSSEHGVTPGTRQTSCKCGWANKSGARIIHGKETKVNEFPWMVHLYIIHVANDVSWASSCGASIITARHVLTAAHCVVSNKIVVRPENLEMILAKHDGQKSTGKEISIKAERIFVPDLYLQKGLSFHDIALIFTKETIDFTTSTVGPICVEREEYPIINRRITIMGWGLTENYVSSPFLRKAKAKVMDPIICGGRAWDVCTVTSPSGTCNGDSGGPLVWLDKDTNRYSQISLVSRGSHKCRGKHSVSTLVAYFYDWIQDIIKTTDPSVRTCHKI